MYKLILLDADNTLFDYDEAEKHALSSSLKSWGFSGNFESIRTTYKEINSSLWRELERGEVTKDRLRSERFERLFNKYNLNYNPAEFSDYYLKKLGEGGFLLDGAEELCSYLNEKYKLVILTNGIKEVQESRLDSSPIKKYITHMVTSEEAGVNKPDPSIFEYTLNAVGHRTREDVIIIGDSLTSDILGGINYSIDTCWFNYNKEDNNSGITPKYCINSLAELKSIL